ncbi:MAG: arsenic resistance N-acetyltransferase ArsN2 [Gammaproteobacteria bacterium]
MQIAQAGAADFTIIRALLAEAGLPFDDLRDSRQTRFLMARAQDGAVTGVAGLELYGKSGLLRSLMVNPAERQRGLGAELTLHLERQAKELGVETLYLLTTSAENFFAARGYKRFERARVPSEIAATTEFKFLCPVTAVCMCKRLV